MPSMLQIVIENGTTGTGTGTRSGKTEKCQYMQDYIDEEFDGIVSGVTEFGVYVELDNTIERMAFCAGSKQTLPAGEKVRIRVLDARPSERQIDLRSWKASAKSKT